MDTPAFVTNHNYFIKLMPTNKGEKTSQWMYNNFVHYETNIIDNIPCCDTAVDAINGANLALPCAISHSHHFDLYSFSFPQDGVINGYYPDKNNMFYAFDTECIQEVDHFQIYIDILTNQTKCLCTAQQDLLPMSLLSPNYSVLPYFNDTLK